LDIHIKWNNDSQSILLPVNPESFILSDSMINTSVNIHNLGEINLKGKRGLQGITLESFFPGQPYNFAKGTFQDPYGYYVKNLKKLMEDNTTVHLIITETEINGFFTIESFNYGHEERNKDVAYSLGLKEYREIGSTSAGSSKSGKRVTKSKKATTVTWKKGDTWQKLTKQILGSSATWKTQKKNNKKVISKAKKKNKGKKENVALIGYKVVIKP